MGRPRKFVEADVLTLAGETFAKQGYGGTSVDDLARATGVGKQSLYNAFGGKRELFLKALSAKTAEAIALVDEELGGEGSTPLERIKAQVLRMAITFSDPAPAGFFVTKAAVEMADQDEEVARSALAAYEQLEAIYRQCIEDAQASGEVDRSANAGELAGFFVALTRGMEVLGAAGVGRARLTGIAVTSLSVLPLTHDG